jgi:serine/threonine protein kinase
MMGDRIGQYRVLRTLGVGGMGEVFLAERADAEFEQQVAIKVVHGGTASRGIHSRLKIERQIASISRRASNCFRQFVPRCITRIKTSSFIVI